MNAKAFLYHANDWRNEGEPIGEFNTHDEALAEARRILDAANPPIKPHEMQMNLATHFVVAHGPSRVIPDLVRAVKLVLALHSQPASADVPGFSVKLDPQAEKQLRAALRLARAE